MEEDTARVAGPWADATPIQRVAALVYSGARMGFLAFLQIGILAAVLGWRPGAYLLLGSFTVYFLARDFAVAVFAISEGTLAELSPNQRTYLTLGVSFFLLVIIGIYASLLGWRPGAYLGLVGLAGHLLGHLAAAVGAYRRVMSRPWPEVPPLADDDDW